MKSSSLIARILFAIAFCIASNPSRTARAQVATPEQAVDAAQELFNRGQTDDAAAAYEKILKDYPTSAVVPQAQFRLGYLSMLQGNYDRSVEILTKLLTPPAPPQIQELAGSMLPQAMSQKAAKMEGGDPKRLAAFNAAIEQYDTFIKKFPKSEEMESAVYGKSVAQYQIKKYDEVVAGLRQNLAQFARSDSIQESEYLLALTLAAQEKYDEADKFLRDIVDKRTNLAVANDAQFQIGEILFSRAAMMDGTARTAQYAKAIEAYQAVKSKDALIKDQQARLATFPQQKHDVEIRRDIPGLQRVQRMEKLETTRLGALKAKAEPTIASQIKIATCYFYQEKYDEACGIFLKMQPLATDDEQKKEIQYYLALSYATQKAIDKAVAAYDQFQSKYKGDPMADNLAVAIAGMFLSPNADSKNLDKAIQYLREGLQIYPKGRLAAQAELQEAAALIGLRRFDEAQKLYRDLLGTNPKREQAATAELGLAGIDKENGKVDAAAAAYKTVRDKYTGLPEAEQAAFWVGQLALAKGDSKTAVTELSAFVEKFPESSSRSSALFYLAQAQQAVGDNDKALTFYKEVTEKYPKSEAAPYAYFQIAAIYGAEQKTDEMVAMMKAFIEKYPGHEKIFFAYDTIGQSEIAASKSAEAIATYGEMAGKYPQDPHAAEALLRVASLCLDSARTLGIYTAMNDAQRAEWNKGISNSCEAAGKLLEKYPESQSVALALQTLFDAQKMLATAKLKSGAEVEKYFRDLADKSSAQPALKSKVLFKLATDLYDRDKAAALQQMTAAYDPKFLYAPADLDLYGSALLESGKVAEAETIFEKLAANNIIPQGTDPSSAAPEVQEAQAIALYGMGKVLQKQGKVAEAGVKFDQLKKLYPWSPKILDATFGIAQSLEQQKKFDEATTLLVGIIRAQTATAELRANSMLLGGDIQNEKGDIEAAIDYYIKIATFYEGVPTAAAAGLWKGGQLLEKQAAGLTETTKPVKSVQLAKAVSAYKDLIQKYPESPFVSQAKTRLQQLVVK